MPREGHGSRNQRGVATERQRLASCPARGMGVEMPDIIRV